MQVFLGEVRPQHSEEQDERDSTQNDAMLLHGGVLLPVSKIMFFMKGLSRIVVALSCLLSAAGGGQAQNLVCSSGKGGWQGPLQRVVVLRPRVKMMKNSLDDVRLGASEQTEAGFHSELARAFADKGYKLWLDPPLTPDWEHTPQTDAAVKQLKDHFDSLFPKTLFGGPD